MERLLWCLNVRQSKGLVFSLPFFTLCVSECLHSYLLVIQQQLLYNCWEEIIIPFQRKDRIRQFCITNWSGWEKHQSVSTVRLSWSINVSYSLLLKSLLVVRETIAVSQKVLALYG